jgi:hypothetical protein
MNLISCESCGVVLDKDRLYFPKNIENDDGSIDMAKAEWDGDLWVAKVPCPVCEHAVLDN